MKRVVVSALLLFGLGVLPSCAQRGGSHGGFSGHSASGFHGGFSSPGRSGFAAAPRVSMGGYARVAPGYAVRGPGFSGVRPPIGRPVGRRPGGFGPDRRGRGVVAVSPWIDPGYLGYPDSYFDSDAGDDQPYYPQQPEYGAAPEAEPDGQMPPPPYVAQGPPQQAVAAPLPSEDAVTILFKDGRAPLQIHNYALTRTTLYVRDQRHRDIPLDELDLAATVKANHDAGVDFQLPAMQ
jgi:hypothetical protein